MSAAGQGIAPYDNQEIERAGSRNNERSSFFLVSGRPFSGAFYADALCL